MDVLLGDVGHAIGGGWAEMPGVERSNDFVVHLMAKRLQNAGFGNVALSVDRNFDNHVALNSGWQGGARYVGANDGQRRLTDKAHGRAVRQRSLLRAGLERIRNRIGSMSVVRLPGNRFLQHGLADGNRRRLRACAQFQRGIVYQLGNDVPAPKREIRGLYDAGMERTVD